MGTILIADDHPVNRQLLATVLRYTSHRVIEACDGAEALQMTRRERPDLAIVDLLMPEIDGYEFARQLRSDPSIANTPIVFHSAAYHELESRPLAEACGVHSFLPKPADPMQLLKLVEALIHQTMESAPAPPTADYERVHRRLLTDKLAKSASELEAANLRLAALNELGQQLASEHDARRMLVHCCDAAREILGCKYVLTSVIERDDEQPRHFFVSGMNAKMATQHERPTTFQGLLKEIVDGEVRQANGLRGDPRAVGLPKQFSNVNDLLGVPIKSSFGLKGCLCFFDKAGGAEFSREDRAVATTIAAQLTVAYENARRREELEQEVVRRIRATDELRAMTVKNEVLEEFAQVAARDLQAPLSTAATNLSLAIDCCRGKVDDVCEQALNNARVGIARMNELISGLLQYARAGGIIERAPVNCDEAVQECLENLAVQIEECQAQITCEPLPVVRADRERLMQLFQNLVGNAIKYRDLKSNRAPEVHIRAEQQHAKWLFSIRDNGIGITPRYTSDIFICFRRLHGASEYPGAGIGLAMCKKIVESHGGQIWVESEPGKGSTFFFTIAG